MGKSLPWDSQSKMQLDRLRESGTYIRQRSDDLYHTSRWSRLSRAWRRAHPLCEECRRKGMIVAGEVTDHIVPFPICRSYFYDESNLQTLCAKCNEAKGQRDKEVIREWKLSRQE